MKRRRCCGMEENRARGNRRGLSLDLSTALPLSLSLSLSHIIIDDRLQFKDHCDYVLKKSSKRISFLNRIGNSVLGSVLYINLFFITCLLYITHFEYVILNTARR